MLPNQLTAASFRAYPEEARHVATRQLALLQQLPLAFLPLLLRELIEYDWKFPMERRELDKQLDYLSALPAAKLKQWTAPFAQLRLTDEIERLDWVNTPAQFSEQLTAHLWATHQIDAFHQAAVDYIHDLNAATPPPPPLPAPRLTIVLVGQGVAQNRYPLFRKLRPHGVYFTQVNGSGGAKPLLDAVVARAAAQPVAFGHWYLDGGTPEAVSCAGLTCMSYRSLDRVRSLLLTKIEAAMRTGIGSEALRSQLARMRPEELGVSGSGDAAVLQQFQISVLTEGSGTQIFATTFAQWSAREILRRAQPLTLLVRFAPRLREQSLKEIIAKTHEKPVLDPEGSLIDADMGAYYTWINQQRLPGAEEASFLVWFENHNEALAIAPSLPRAQQSAKPIDLDQLVQRIT
jgi:hypothetical protein